MSKSSGGTRTISSNNAAQSRTQSVANATTNESSSNVAKEVDVKAYNANIEKLKMQALKGGIPKVGESRKIQIGDKEWVVSVHQGGKNQYVADLKESNNYKNSMMHVVYYTGTKTPYGAAKRQDAVDEFRSSINYLFNNLMKK